MRLHLVGLPHTQLSKDVSVCAFTSKSVKFGKMMQADYDVIFYWGDKCESPCYEHVSVFSDEDQQRWYGELDANTLPSLARWGAEEDCFREMNARAIGEIGKRLDPENDLILLLAGLAQKPIADAFPGAISCEWAIGYDGVFAEYACFESYAWMHYLYGKYYSHLGQGRFYDVAIPNFFDLEEWELPDPTSKQDYLLYCGRLIKNKGIDIAAEIAKQTGRKLIIAGSGMAEQGDGWLKTLDGTLLEGDIEYVGTVNGERRTQLMRDAYATLVPTTYVEPFGAVAVESQLTGTPAITSDWGAFPETVIHGTTGYRIRTLQEGIEAVEAVGSLNPTEIAQSARDRYSLEAIRPLYDAWFRRLNALWREGWYSTNERSTLPGYSGMSSIGSNG